MADRPEGPDLPEIASAIEEPRAAFREALEDDLNTSAALAHMHTFMTRVTRRLTLYRAAAGPVTLWFPVGIFGSNFQKVSPEGGIPFALMPTGVAFGGKVHFDNGFDIGLSGIALYTILPTNAVKRGSALEYPGGADAFEPSATAGGGSVDFDLNVDLYLYLPSFGFPHIPVVSPILKRVIDNIMAFHVKGSVDGPDVDLVPMQDILSLFK